MRAGDHNRAFLKVKGVWTNKGTAESPKIKWRSVDQETAHGHKMDELFAGTPSLTSVKLVLAPWPGHIMMIMDVKVAFPYGRMRWMVYVELP